MQEVDAIVRVSELVDADVDPTLNQNQVRRLVADAARTDAAGNSPLNVATAATWAASTTYAYGDVVTADPAAGRWWRCVVPGVSGSTQPDWPDQTGIRPGVTTVSDDDIRWEDAGTAWTGTYDLNAAAAEGWRLKAAKVAGRFDFGTDGQTFRRGQLISHFGEMERRFRRRVSAGL